jgi:hypothetical protein
MRFKGLRTKIFGEKIKETAQLDGDVKSWTRNRIMTLANVLMSAIGRKALTGFMEIRLFFMTINELPVSKQDYFTRRQHLNYEALVLLNSDYLQDFYAGEEPYCWNGYIVLAIDGSGVEISNSEENRRTFGVVETQYGATVARASISCVNDVLNQFILDIQVTEYKSSELVAAKTQIEGIKNILGERKTLIVFDRGYPSIEFINFLEEQGISYLIRLKSSNYRKERENRGSDEEEVAIKHTYQRMAALKKKDPVLAQKLIDKKFTKARIIETDIGKGKTNGKGKKRKAAESGWAFITNLAEAYTGEEIGKLYWKRWNIEKKFHTLKNKMKFESNTGKASIYVRQDFWAQVIAFNMTQDVIHSNEEELQEQSKNYTYEMRINENIAIGLFKEQIIRILIEGNVKKQGVLFDILAAEILENIVPVRVLPSKDRKWNYFNKYKCNQKPSY